MCYNCIEQHIPINNNIQRIIVYIYSLLSVGLELPVADLIKQHHVYSVRTIKIFPYEII